MSKNLPWFKFYPRDWLTDEKLRRCRQGTRCFWLEAICHMYLSDTVSLTGSCDELSRVLSCTVAEVQTAVSDLKIAGAAEIDERNGIITLTSRRRVKEMRRKEICQNAGNISAARRKGDVMPLLTSSSDSGSGGIGDARGKGAELSGFARFWSEYPGDRKADKQKCCDKWERDGLEEKADIVLAGLAWWKNHRDWKKKDGEFICAPLVWLNQKRWEAADGYKPGGLAAKPLTIAEKWAKISLTERADLVEGVRIGYKGNDKAQKMIDEMMAGGRAVDIIVEAFLKLRSEMTKGLFVPSGA